MHNRLIVILGPTGIGKSSIAIKLAQQLNTEILSADSRQFYKEMTIGTAVPPPDYRKKVKHHFIQHIEAKTYYSASRFEEDAIGLLEDLFTIHNDVIMAGGSGLYIDAVCGNIDEIPDVDPGIRKEYLKRFKEEGLESLRSELKIVDPAYYASTDIRNHKRILRALEIFGTTGKPYSSFLEKKGKSRDFEIIKIGLKMDRDKLYRRIELRVDKMMSDGLEKEAKALLPLRDLNALNTVGYKELFAFFDGEITLEKAVELIKRNSRRYAKRQITWWSRDKSIKWFDANNMDGILQYLGR